MSERPGTVLIVEDDLDLRDALVEALHERGYAVLTASDGEEALEVLEAVRPTVILLDLMMPRLDGYAFLAVRSDRADLAGIPVIVASAAPPTRPLSMSTFTEFLAKPYSTESLVSAIERVCAVHRAIGPT